MVLFIDACPIENSRTRILANSYVSGLVEDVETLNLYKTDIPVLDEYAYKERESAAVTEDRNNPFVSMAIQFEDAQKIIIAAPYNNLSYPAVLQSYLEAIMIDGITYTESEFGAIHGNCEAREVVFITAAGGYIQKPDHQFEHIKSIITKIFGISEVIFYSVEGLDLPEADTEAIIREKMDELKIYAAMDLSLNNAKRNIMVVDDSKVNILKTEHILKEEGYHTIPATSGQDCLKKLKFKKADMILLDIEMPGMNGFETLEAIRSLPEYEDVPVVFVTSDNTIEVVIEASQHNISGYVTKPFTKEELMIHVNKAMHERNL